jgi:hypothetical protein
MPIATLLRDVPEATQRRVRERYADFRSYATPVSDRLLQKQGNDVSIEEAWQLHRRRAEDNVGLGRTLREASYEHFVEMSEIEENAVLPPKGRVAR